MSDKKSKAQELLNTMATRIQVKPEYYVDGDNTITQDGILDVIAMLIQENIAIRKELDIIKRKGYLNRRASRMPDDNIL